MEKLEDKERELDEQRLWVQQSLKNVSEDPENEQLAYVTYEDVCRSFKGDTLLVVQAPSGTQLEVPIPDTVSLGSFPWYFYEGYIFGQGILNVDYFLILFSMLYILFTISNFTMKINKTKNAFYKLLGLLVP